MKKTHLLPLAAVLLIAAAGTVWLLARPNRHVNEKPAAPAIPVTLAMASIRDMPVLLDTVGRTEAYESVSLRSRIDGQVQSIHFTEGQHVSKGELLIQLDPADYQARLAQASANQEKSLAQAGKAKSDLDRYQALKAKGFVSEEKVSDTRTALASAQASASADAAAAHLARLQLSYTRLSAPFDGIVGSRLVSPGATIKNNDTPLVTLNRVRPLYISFALPEKYLPLLLDRLRGGEKVMKAAITLPADPASRFDAEVRFIDNSVDPSTGTIQLKAVLPNEDETLTAGQFVNVSLLLDTLKSIIVIPSEAVQRGDAGDFVFVVRDGLAQVRKISVKTTQQSLAVVSDGLTDKDEVVVEGQLRLTPGARVRSATSEPAKHP